MKNDSEILLSIVIPTKDRANYLYETLNSILTNVIYPIEIIIVDGNSKDNTGKIIEKIKSLYELVTIQYYKQEKNNGFDYDLDYGVKKANGKFIWLFSDDDLVYPNTLNHVFNIIISNQEIDLILLNSSIHNINFSEVLQDKFIINKIVGTSNDMNKLFETCIKYLTFFGCVIIKKDKWNFSISKQFYGSYFIHVAQIFNNERLNWVFENNPLIKIRYGNASWSTNSFNIWLIFWPKLIDSFKFISLKSKLKIYPNSFVSQFKMLFFYKALGRIKNKDILRVYNDNYKFLLLISIAIFPQFICYFITYLYSYICNKSILLNDLKNIDVK